MSKLLVHIGYPKTATSTLQDRLLYPMHNDGLINFLGKSCLENAGFNPAGNLVTHLVKGMDEPVEILTLNEEKLNVISNEDLALSFYNIDNRKYLFESNPIHTAKRLERYVESRGLDKATDVKIVGVIRNQADLIHSMYAEAYTWYFRHEKSLNTFEKFIEQGLRKGQDGVFLMFFYEKVFSTYAEIFGEDNVSILFFEDILHDIDSFTSSFASLVNVDSSQVVGALATKDNVKNKNSEGYETKGLSLDLVVSNALKNNLLFGGASKYLRKLGILRRVYGLIMNKAKSISVESPKLVPFLTETQKEDIGLLFEEDNLCLCRKFHLDLNKMKNYGYVES